ncbi:MAG TPA: hypothetical protein ENJ99_04860 [Rhizobiales bacterium]|nr:hypothetical protein [Hyphomicrobiales bacterium]
MPLIVKPDSHIATCLTRKPFSFRHELAKSSLFEDEQLAGLIETARRAGPENYSLGTLDHDGFGAKWQTGVLGDLSGGKLLEAIRNGRLWLQIQNLADIAPEYFDLAKRAYGDIRAQAPGFSFHNLLSSVLISSPAARVLCHIDCAEVILFHIRGRKRVWLYDPESKAGISDETIEKIILREEEEEIPYAPEWDREAVVFDMEPGMAANWPHLWPHRVDNIEGLNVSFQTEFYSSQGLRRYGAIYANGLLRRRAGLTPRPVSTGGLAGLVKSGFGLVAKKCGLHKPAERKIISRFTVDPAKPGSINQLDSTHSQVLMK